MPQTTSSDDLQDNQSGSLRGFRETLKDVLEDITTLEVNTIVVSNISTDKFDARKYYEDVLNSNTYENIKKMENSVYKRCFARQVH